VTSNDFVEISDSLTIAAARIDGGYIACMCVNAVAVRPTPAARPSGCGAYSAVNSSDNDHSFGDRVLQLAADIGSVAEQVDWAYRTKCC